MVALEPGPQPDAKYEARFVATATQRGHSQWFLQQTVKDHAATQYHPFMEAIFRSTLETDLYCRCSRMFSFDAQNDRLCQDRLRMSTGKLKKGLLFRSERAGL